MRTKWVAEELLHQARARGALAGSGIACAPVDAALSGRYIERFVAAGYLPRPS